MSQKQREKATQSNKRLYGLWGLGIGLVIIVVVVSVVLANIPQTSSSPSPMLSSSTAVPPSPIPISSPLEIPRITPEEVKVKLDTSANIAIVDTRSNSEYARGHIMGAISIPLEEISRRYKELQRYSEIVTYCT